MKRPLAVSLTLLGLCASALAATPASVQFIGTLQQDGTTPVTFNIQVPSGQTAKLELGDGHVLAFATWGSPETPDSTTITLTDASGKRLHSQTIPDAGLESTSFTYLICEGQPRFISPTPEHLASCSP